MKILIVNDDGIKSEGIKLLIKKISKYGEVFIVAPEHEQSGSSSKFTYQKGLVVTKYSENEFGVSGTPVDCVKIALHGLYIKPDLIVSGINNGPNLGTDVIYSGTIAAATEGLINKIPSISLSCDNDNFDIVDKHFGFLMDFIFNNNLINKNYLLNINFPSKSWDGIKGIKQTVQGNRVFGNYFLKKDGLYLNKGNWKELENSDESDVSAFNNGFISITPMDLNRTATIDLKINESNYCDEDFMQRAIELASKGNGMVAPNPLVGCVIVKHGRIIGEGYHKKFGSNHAEVEALNSCSESPEGATMYVTLEPCCHFGKTPPCTERIIESNISKVIIGIKDPNKLVAGKGIRQLRKARIEVEAGLLEEEIMEQNRFFIKHIQTGMPYVILKSATTMDGKIATRAKKSKWITSEESRMHAHSIRNDVASILVGVNTILEDNPSLTSRIVNGINPIRVIVDSKGEIPMKSNVFNNDGTEVVIATTNKCDENKYIAHKVIILESDGDKIRLKMLMKELGSLGINSVLIEGGGTINFSALEEGIVDEVHTYIAPKLFGGKESITSVEGIGVYNVNDAFEFEFKTIERIGNDLFINSRRRRMKCLQD